MTTLGERIKAYREQLKISQKELADRCNDIDNRSENTRWGQPRIANYEKGNRTPDLEDISIISKALGILPEVLAFDSNVSVIEEKVYRYPLLSPIQA